jgi:hypothetical protein
MHGSLKGVIKDVEPFSNIHAAINSDGFQIRVCGFPTPTVSDQVSI